MLCQTGRGSAHPQITISAMDRSDSTTRLVLASVTVMLSEMVVYSVLRGRAARRAAGAGRVSGVTEEDGPARLWGLPFSRAHTAGCWERALGWRHRATCTAGRAVLSKASAGDSQIPGVRWSAS